ncbi:MAG: hypothetical protein R3296_02610 [Oleiphilaceae bacterium]|nr:hypothetical protein [Oleiphilaceae bacterium]
MCCSTGTRPSRQTRAAMEVQRDPRLDNGERQRRRQAIHSEMSALMKPDMAGNPGE